MNTARREGEKLGRDKAEKRIRRAENKAKAAESKVDILAEKAIKAMIHSTNHSDEAIATFLDVPIERIQKIRKLLKLSDE